MYNISKVREVRKIRKGEIGKNRLTHFCLVSLLKSFFIYLNCRKFCNLTVTKGDIYTERERERGERGERERERRERERESGRERTWKSRK